MKNLILLLTGLLFPYVLLSQATLKGAIVDLETGEPILFASISIYKNGVLVTGIDSDLEGRYNFHSLSPGKYDVACSYVGYQTEMVKNVVLRADSTTVLNFSLKSGVVLSEVSVVDYAVPLVEMDRTTAGGVYQNNDNQTYKIEGGRMSPVGFGGVPIHNTENYAQIQDNRFRLVGYNPLSTFSIDVDGASYANTRRFLNQGNMPEKGAVRIEEFINYFNYDYAAPVNKPIAAHQEIGECPWNTDHYLLKIGLQGRKLQKENLPPSHLVFLIDVSGSMRTPLKLDLLKKGMKLLVHELGEEDKISIVVYAGAAGVILPPTSGDRKGDIMEALNKLSAGGSTAGSEGLKLAYKVASEHFIEGGNNRIILATDGDFNVGVSSNSEMKDIVETNREKGIDMSVLGFGYGNLKDDRLEIIAQYGNGNYNYIDNVKEAKKVLIDQFGGTLFTIAKDVKLQIEFNPALIESYRLIGYENRMLAEEDFKDDTKDAGDLGVGHTVTALYELVPAITSTHSPKVELKYSKSGKSPTFFNRYKNEFLTTSVRYKEPKGSESKLLTFPLEGTALNWEDSSDDFKFAAAVAAFGMLLRESEYAGDSNYSKVKKWAAAAMSGSSDEYKREFLDLVDVVISLQESVGMTDRVERD